MRDFKRDIDLVAFAADPRFGYVRDKKRSTQRTAVLESHVGSDKIAVSRAPDSTWIYYSFTNDRDNGTIIDFVMQRESLRSPAEACKFIATWEGPSLRASAPSVSAALVPFDRMAFAKRLQATHELRDFSYLVGARCLNASLVQHRRFATTIGQDAAGRVLFFHRDQDGICGWEEKGPSWTSFAKGGKKALWSSNVSSSDTTLVVAEAALDALSYAQLHPTAGTQYKSFGGAFGPPQVAELRLAVERIPASGRVVLALDNDVAGDRFAARLTDELASTGRAVVRHSPEHHKDWNDVVKHLAQERGEQPRPPPAFSL